MGTPLSRRGFIRGATVAALAAPLSQGVTTASASPQPHDAQSTGRLLMFKKWNYGPTPLADYKTYVDEIAGDGFNAMKVHLPWAKVVSRSDLDGPGSADDATYLKQASESFAHGATVLCVANWGNLATLQARRSLFRTIADKCLAAEPIALDKQIRVPVSVQRMLTSGSKPDQTTYDSLSRTGEKRIRVPLIDDLTHS